MSSCRRRTIQNWNLWMSQITYSRPGGRAEGNVFSRLWAKRTLPTSLLLNSTRVLFCPLTLLPKIAFHTITGPATTSTIILRQGKSVAMATETVYMLEIEFLVCLERAITDYWGRHKTFFA